MRLRPRWEAKAVQFVEGAVLAFQAQETAGRPEKIE
jgi:hypothetical protein